MKALFCKEKHCNKTKILSLCQTMLVIGLAVRHGKKNLGQVHQNETAQDAISFIIAFFWYLHPENTRQQQNCRYAVRELTTK